MCKNPPTIHAAGSRHNDQVNSFLTKRDLDDFNPPARDNITAMDSQFVPDL
jgi:hypothetical protein